MFQAIAHALCVVTNGACILYNAVFVFPPETGRLLLRMAQNQLNDLMEERVYPIVTSIRGFFGSFG